MSNSITFSYTVSKDDFTRVGEASSDVKSRLKKLGVDNTVIRKVAIAMYEGEINMVIHADGGTIDVDIDDDGVHILLQDVGPGIADIEKAMQAGFSTAPENIRALGFGAGMGLPNMKKNSDTLNIKSTINVGTTVTMDILF